MSTAHNNAKRSVTKTSPAVQLVPRSDDFATEAKVVELNARIEELERQNSELTKFKELVREIDRITQTEMKLIAALASVAQKSLESPDAIFYVDHLAVLLKRIWANAEGHENAINSMAEDVNCDFSDEEWSRESLARYKARDKAVASLASPR